jgi:hypothetical protein
VTNREVNVTDALRKVGRSEHPNASGGISIQLGATLGSAFDRTEPS